MIECPDCGGYNTARHFERDEDGDLLYTEWRCGDCGAEWIEDSEKAADAPSLAIAPLKARKPVDVWPDRW